MLRKFILHFNRFPHFLMTGMVGYTVSLGLTVLLTEYARLWYLLSFLIGAFTGLVCSFIINSVFTFKDHKKDGSSRRFALYLGYYLINGIITFALIYLLTSVWGLHYVLSIVGITVVSNIVTFLVNKKWIFVKEG